MPAKEVLTGCEVISGMPTQSVRLNKEQTALDKACANDLIRWLVRQIHSSPSSKLQPSLQSFSSLSFFDRSVGAKIDNLSVAEPNVKGDWNKKGVRVRGERMLCVSQWAPPLSNQRNGEWSTDRTDISLDSLRCIQYPLQGDISC